MPDIHCSGPIGLPLDRVDGPLKVTGRATYAFEYAGLGKTAYGVIVPAAIGKGRVAAVDVPEAQRAPGVLLVVTKDNAPPQTPWGPLDLPDRFARSTPALDTDDVEYFGFPAAFIVAETFEQAVAAAALVRIRYESSAGEYDLRAAAPRAENPGVVSTGEPADSAIGDFDGAFASAPVKVDAAYTTPYQHQTPMEPHATMAEWEGSKLTVHMAAQLTTSPREGLARIFDIPPENVRVITRYVGGGFGSKLPYFVDATLAAIGARMLGRPVKVAMARPQMFHFTTHRTASEQRLRLGADHDGRLTAYGQDALTHCARFDNYTEPVCIAARMLYAAPNRLTRHRRAKLDLPRADSMRAPGDSIGLMALECAMDELAEVLRLDPVELRLRNDTQTDPEQNRPFSIAASGRVVARRRVSVRLDQTCCQAWHGPRRGVAGRSRCRSGHSRRPIEERERPRAAGARQPIDGRAAMTDIGTGSYTILTQIAAETMEMPVERVTVRLGDTRFPPTAGSGGSFGAGTSGGAVLQPVGSSRPDSPPASRKAEGSVTPADLDGAYSHAGFGAHFAEVGVGPEHRRGSRTPDARGVRGRPHSQRQDRAVPDAWRHDVGHWCGAHGGELRRLALRLLRRSGPGELSRAGECRCRRARGSASRRGRPARQSVGEQRDRGARHCGAGAAVINAIYNATGARIRDFPATLDKLLPTLEVLTPRDDRGEGCGG